MKVVLLNNRYPSKTKPFVASYVKSIYDILRPIVKVRLLVSKINGTGKMARIFEILFYQLVVLLSPKIRWAEVIYANHINLYWRVLRYRLGEKHLIIHWHGSELYGSKRFSYISEWQDDSKIINAIHIVPSHHFGQRLQKHIPAIREFKVIPSGGVDTDLFKPVRGSGNSDTWVVGFASHLTYDKGVDFFKKIASEKEELEREIGGKIHFKAIKYGYDSDHEIDALKALEVELIPPMIKEKMPLFYQSLDLLLFPSRHESLGLVALEGMGCGVPVLCPKDYAAPEYCKPGISGELFEPGNYQSFVENMKLLLNNIKTYDPSGIVAKSYSKNYVMARYQELLKALP